MKCIRETKHPNHPLVKAFKEKGHSDIFLIFAPRFSPDYGWTAETDKFNDWIGFTKKEALKYIKEKL